jgi:hypothetical protein
VLFGFVPYGSDFAPYFKAPIRPAFLPLLLFYCFGDMYFISYIVF